MSTEQGPADAASVERLIAAYHETFRALEQLPRVFWVPWRRGRSRIRALRVSGGCRYFLTPHVRARLERLARVMNERLALDPSDTDARADLDRISHYQASLAGPPLKRLLLVYGLLAACVATLLGAVMFPGLEIGHRITSFEGDLLSLNLVKAFDTAREDPANSIVALLLIASALALILAPLIASFRLKRSLLANYPGGAPAVRRANVGDVRVSAAGVYDLEARTFRAVGLERPRELPCDLALHALRTLILLPLWIALAFAAAQQVIGIALPQVPGWAAPLTLVMFAVLAPWRFQDLLGVYRARHGVVAQVAPGFVAAGTRARIIATYCDLSLAGLGGFALGLLLVPIPMNDTLRGLLMLFVLFPATGVAIALISHLRGHQTPGKAAAGIEVVGFGDQPRLGTRAVLKRETFKWFVEIGASLVLLAPIIVTVIVTLRDPADRALHDRVGETAVRDRPLAHLTAATAATEPLGRLDPRTA